MGKAEKRSAFRHRGLMIFTGTTATNRGCGRNHYASGNRQVTIAKRTIEQKRRNALPLFHPTLADGISVTERLIKASTSHRLSLLKILTAIRGGDLCGRYDISQPVSKAVAVLGKSRFGQFRVFLSGILHAIGRQTCHVAVQERRRVENAKKHFALPHTSKAKKTRGGRKPVSHEAAIPLLRVAAAPLRRATPQTAFSCCYQQRAVHWQP